MQYTSPAVEQHLRDLGAHVRSWRKIHGLTAAMVADRAGVTRATLRAIETGSGSARLENVVSVLVVLGVADDVVKATDPLATSLGRARADRLGQQRVRTPTW